MNIGKYTFSGVRSIGPEFLEAASVAKILGPNKSVVTSWGAYGAVPWYIEATLTGLTGKTDLWNCITELQGKNVVRLKADLLNGLDAYGRVLSIRPVEQVGFVESGVKYVYPVTITFLSQCLSDEADRGIMYGQRQETDTFGLTGVAIIPLPAAATGTSETVDFDRIAIFSYKSGAYWMPSGTCTLPCVMAPTLSQSKVTYTVAAEADLDKAPVNLSRSGTGYVLDNGLERVATSHPLAANQGYIELSIASGAAWTKFGDLRLWLENTGGTLQEITAGVPEVFTFFGGDPERQMLRLQYPATTSGADQGAVELELERGRPYVKATLYNADSTSKDKCYYQLDTASGAAYFWCTGAGTAVDVSGAAIGTPASGSGDADTLNLHWMQSTSTTGAGTMIGGFARKKLANTYHFAYDSGYQYSYIGEQFDGVTINKGYAFEPAWVLAYKYDQAGSWPAPSGASEALDRITAYQTVIPRT